MSKRFTNVQSTLMNNTVLNEWFLPMQKTLNKVRFSRQKYSVLSSGIARGVGSRLSKYGESQQSQANLTLHIQVIELIPCMFLSIVQKLQ